VKFFNICEISITKELGKKLSRYSSARDRSGKPEASEVLSVAGLEADSPAPIFIGVPPMNALFKM
jgi:hypothetical protein